MRGTFKFLVHDLDTAGRPYTAKVPVSWLQEALSDAEVTPDGDGEFTVRISKTGTTVFVKGHVHVKMSVPCARCLDPARCDADAEVALTLVPTTSPKAAFAVGKVNEDGAAGKEYEFKDADAELDTYENEEVVLDPFLREALILEIPAFPLCNPDCSGIARAPASTPTETEAEIDPRLAPLREFAKKPN
jgi:uncharacterized protein